MPKKNKILKRSLVKTVKNTFFVEKKKWVKKIFNFNYKNNKETNKGSSQSTSQQGQ
jgi:hypothetical protein